jgi:ElaB/YqjD/DUF883 family membrane-anchored ribosome-binding protein
MNLVAAKSYFDNLDRIKEEIAEHSKSENELIRDMAKKTQDSLDSAKAKAQEGINNASVNLSRIERTKWW